MSTIEPSKPTEADIPKIPCCHKESNNHVISKSTNRVNGKLVTTTTYCDGTTTTSSFW